MDGSRLQLFRHILAGLNGILFAVGVWWTLDTAFLRVRRWRKRLAALLRMQELAQNNSESTEHLEQEINLLHERLTSYNQDPRTRLQLGLGILMVGIALAALFGLIAPPWATIIR